MSEKDAFIKRIEQLPVLLEEAVHNLSDKQLDTPVGEGKWTSRQIVHHIADANMNAYIRMKLIATEEKPILKPYDQDSWAALADSNNGAIESSLTLIKGLHQHWVQFLQSLPESSWTREGIHLENGKVTLSDVLRIYSNHGSAHLQQIVSFLEKRKW